MRGPRGAADGMLPGSGVSGVFAVAGGKTMSRAGGFRQPVLPAARQHGFHCGRQAHPVTGGNEYRLDPGPASEHGTNDFAPVFELAPVPFSGPGSR